MAQPSTDQHEDRLTVWEGAHHASAAAYLPVQPLKTIIGTDLRSVLAGKIAVGQRFFNAIFHLWGSLFQFHRAQFFHNSLGLLLSSFLSLLGVDRLEHFGYQFHLRARCDREHVTVEADGVGIWPQETLLPQPSACQGICVQPPACLRPGHGHGATGRNCPSWLCLLSCPRQRQEPHGNRLH